MKSPVIFYVFVAVVFGIAGCRQEGESETKDAITHAMASQNSANHDHAQQEESMHNKKEHHHAFTAPEQLAKKWNNKERDEWQHPEEIVTALELKRGATVADIGAGTGYMVAHLSDAVGEGGTVIAIDAEAAMIEYLTKHKSHLGKSTIVP